MKPKAIIISNPKTKLTIYKDYLKYDIDGDTNIIAKHYTIHIIDEHSYFIAKIERT